MKESGSDIGADRRLVARTPDDFTVLAGSATTFFHALCAGCDGGILALAALLPERACGCRRSCRRAGSTRRARCSSG